jgi:hypothetical protein
VSDALREWESFYVIVGSSAGALTGLQFVVLTLISEAGVVRGTSDTLSAFASPNVVHFCAALLVSALFSTPWHGLGGPSVAVGICGICGFIYSVMVLRRALRQKDYKPVLEDWVWHAALPMLAYAALSVAGLTLASDPEDTLFVVGGAALLLVFVGIHNAWDTVTYVMSQRTRERRAQAPAATAAAALAPVAPVAPLAPQPVSPERPPAGAA